MHLKGAVRTLKWAFHFIVENDLELLKAFFDSPASISKVLGFSGVSQWLLCLDQTQDLECLGKYSTNRATSVVLLMFLCLFWGVNSQAILL